MKIPQRARQISPINVQVSTPSISAPNQSGFGTDIGETLMNVTKATENIAKINYSMQDQRDEIALSTFKSNADLLSKAYVEDIKNVKDIKDIDLKKQQLEKEIEASAKGIVPDNIYNGWKAREGLVFNAEVNYATERVRTEKNIDKAKEDSAQTALNFANLRYLAKTPQQAEYYRNQYKGFLDKLVTGDNQTGVKVYSQEEATKLLFNFDKQYDVTNIEELINGTPEEMINANGVKTKVNSLGNPLQAIKDLEDKNKYKTFTPEERQKYTQEALKQSVLLHATSKDEKVSNIVLRNYNEFQNGDRQKAINEFQYITEDTAGYAKKYDLTSDQVISVMGSLEKMMSNPRDVYGDEEGQVYDKAVYDFNAITSTDKNGKTTLLTKTNKIDKMKKLVGGNNGKLQSVQDIMNVSENLLNSYGSMFTTTRKKDINDKMNTIGDIMVENIKNDGIFSGLVDGDNDSAEYAIKEKLKEYYKNKIKTTDASSADFDTRKIYLDFVKYRKNHNGIQYTSQDKNIIETYNQDIEDLIMDLEGSKFGRNRNQETMLIGKKIYRRRLNNGK